MLFRSGGGGELALVGGLVVKRRIVGELGVQAKVPHGIEGGKGAVSREGKMRACLAHRRMSMVWLCCGSLCGLRREIVSCGLGCVVWIEAYPAENRRVWLPHVPGLHRRGVE